MTAQEKWNQKHKDQLRKYRMTWYKNHKAHQAKYERQYRLIHK